MLHSLPLLSLLIWVPILLGIALITISKVLQPKTIKNLALTSASCSCVIILQIFRSFAPSAATSQQLEFIQLLPGFLINYSLGIDGIALLLVSLNILLGLLAILIINKQKYYHKLGLYSGLLLILQGLVSGVFLARDLILFYMFFEAMLIPMLLLIGIWGETNRIYAALKFLVFSMLGSIGLLIAFSYLLIQYKIFGLSDPDSTINSLITLKLDLQQQKWLFAAMMCAFAIKLPILPLHAWLPTAHVAAPTGASVLLAGIFLKVAGYGILRIVLASVPDACQLYAEYMIWIALATVVYISFIILVQQDLKKIVAYSSIAHMALVILGIFVAVALLSTDAANLAARQAANLAVNGAVLQMLAHGLIVAGLFICIGILQEKFNSKQMPDYSGLAIAMPKFAVFFMIFGFAGIGLPGTFGFVGECLILAATIKLNFYYAVIAGTIIIFSAVYTLNIFRNIIFGVVKTPQAVILTKQSSQYLALFILALVIIGFGLFPNILLHIATFDIAKLMQVIR